MTNSSYSSSILFMSVLILCCLSFSSENKLKAETKTSQTPLKNYLDKVVTFKSVFNTENVMTDVTSSFVGVQEGPDSKRAKHQYIPRTPTQFIIRRALNGQDGYVSIESVKFENYFMRHTRDKFIEFLNKDSNTDSKDDASFRIVPGRNGASNAVSFESFNFPGHFITLSTKSRSGFGKCKLIKGDDSAFKKEHFSWIIVA
jgi:hypothetical protein